MKTNDLQVLKVDKNNWAKTNENLAFHLKFVREMRGAPLAYVVRHHVKMTHISPGCGAYLNLDEEVIIRIPIFDAKSNLKLTQDCLDRVRVHRMSSCVL